MTTAATATESLPEPATPETERHLLSWNLSERELIDTCSTGTLGLNGRNIQNRVVDADFARTLERQRNAALARVAKLEAALSEIILRLGDDSIPKDPATEDALGDIDRIAGEALLAKEGGGK